MTDAPTNTRLQSSSTCPRTISAPCAANVAGTSSAIIDAASVLVKNICIVRVIRHTAAEVRNWLHVIRTQIWYIATMTLTIRWHQIGLLLALVATPLVAQTVLSSAPTGQLPVVPLLVPGDSTLRGSRISADTARYSLIAYRGAQQQQIGSVIDIVALEARNGAPMIQRVLTVQRGMAALIDSTVTDARTMAPRSHRTLQPQRRIALEFSGKRVKGSLGPIDVPSLPIDTTLAVAPFDSGNWDLLLRAMPLVKGYTARFRVYDVDGGLREYHIEVTGMATVLGEDAHVVVFSLAPGRESVVWIGKTSGHLLQIETLIDANTMLRQLRQARP